jgi:hypothetical protein
MGIELPETLRTLQIPDYSLARCGRKLWNVVGSHINHLLLGVRELLVRGYTTAPRIASMGTTWLSRLTLIGVEM